MEVDLLTIFSRGESRGAAIGKVGNAVVRYARNSGKKFYAIGKIETIERENYFSASARSIFMQRPSQELEAFRKERERGNERGIDGLYEELKGNTL